MKSWSRTLIQANGQSGTAARVLHQSEQASGDGIGSFEKFVLIAEIENSLRLAERPERNTVELSSIPAGELSATLSQIQNDAQQRPIELILHRLRQFQVLAVFVKGFG